MTKQRNKISFSGQTVFVGIDVHRKSWDVTAMTYDGYKKSHIQPPSADALLEFLKKHFTDGNYLAVYESGFSGFATYYELTSVGIRCILVNAADVSSTQYERVMKTDRRDSGRLANELRKNGENIKGRVYVHSRENIDDRSLVRLRSILRTTLQGYRSRIKHHLYCNGVEVPARLGGYDARWTNAFLAWLKSDEVKLLSKKRQTLDWMIIEVNHLHGSVLEVTGKIRELSRSERYATDCAYLRSIPGIGLLTAMSILVEIEDPARFRNENQFASYLGLIPTSHNSGDKVTNGEKTFRANHWLGPLIIESSWIAIRLDSALASVYGKHRLRMNPAKAIVAVARKLSNRVRAVLIKKENYIYDKC
jgi:transposase